MMYIKKSNRFTLLFIVLTIGLGLSAVGYAHLEDILYVDGYIGTGTLSWAWHAVFDSDGSGELDLNMPVHPDDLEVGYPPSGVPFAINKDIAETIVEVSGDTATITINNAYPWYAVHINFAIQNTGSVPWRLWYLYCPEAEGTGLYWNTHIGWVGLDLDGDGCYEAYLWLEDGFGDQIDPGPDGILDLSATLYITNCVSNNELDQLTFDIDWYCLNWNEWWQPPGTTFPYGFKDYSAILPPLPGFNYPPEY